MMERKEFIEKAFLILDYELEKMLRELEEEAERNA